MNIGPHDSLRTLVLELPAASKVLATHGIDAALDGQQSLQKACDHAGVPVHQVLEEILEARLDTPPTRTDRHWLEAPLGELIDELVTVHHEGTRRLVERARRFAAEAVAREAAVHPELLAIRDELEALEAELEPHMRHEEREIFPYIRALERVRRDPSARLPPQASTASLEHEHRGQRELLQAVRSATAGFVPPEDASPATRRLYQALEELEERMTRHLHLENNVLFPRARRLQAEQHAQHPAHALAR